MNTILFSAINRTPMPVGTPLNIFGKIGYVTPPMPKEVEYGTFGFQPAGLTDLSAPPHLRPDADIQVDCHQQGMMWLTDKPLTPTQEIAYFQCIVSGRLLRHGWEVFARTVPVKVEKVERIDVGLQRIYVFGQDGPGEGPVRVYPFASLWVRPLWHATPGR